MNEMLCICSLPSGYCVSKYPIFPWITIRKSGKILISQRSSALATDRINVSAFLNHFVLFLIYTMTSFSTKNRSLFSSWWKRCQPAEEISNTTLALHAQNIQHPQFKYLSLVPPLPETGGALKERDFHFCQSFANTLLCQSFSTGIGKGKR